MPVLFKHLLTRMQNVDTFVSTKRGAMNTSASQISTWGNGLALRLTKPMAKAAGVADGTPVRVTIKPGRIVIESETEPTLEQMLAAFDPRKHGGEALAGAPVGMEAFVQ